MKDFKVYCVSGPNGKEAMGSYDTREEAEAAIPDFKSLYEEDGITGTHFKIEETETRPNKFVTKYPTGECYLVCTNTYDGAKVFHAFAIRSEDAIRVTNNGFPFVDYEKLSEFEQRDIAHRVPTHKIVELYSFIVDGLISLDI